MIESDPQSKPSKAVTSKSKEASSADIRTREESGTTTRCMHLVRRALSVGDSHHQHGMQRTSSHSAAFAPPHAHALASRAVQTDKRGCAHDTRGVKPALQRATAAGWRRTRCSATNHSADEPPRHPHTQTRLVTERRAERTAQAFDWQGPRSGLDETSETPK